MSEQYLPQWHVAADVVIFAGKHTEVDGARGLSVLMIERKNDPYAGKLALPGGFVETSERLEEAAARELVEETTVKLEPGRLQQIGAYWYPGRDPRGTVLSVAFVVLLDEQVVTKAGDDAARSSWYSLEAVMSQPETLAFDHAQILQDALRKYHARAVSF